MTHTSETTAHIKRIIVPFTFGKDDHEAMDRANALVQAAIDEGWMPYHFPSTHASCADYITCESTNLGLASSGGSPCYHFTLIKPHNSNSCTENAQ